MKRTLPTLLACFVVGSGAAIAGCGGDDNATVDANGASTPQSAPAASDGDVVTISMKDVLFTPENATVKVGQTVKWLNDDPIDHTATAKSGADFDSGNVKANGTFEFTPEKAGTIEYVCTIHPSQKGTLTVE